MSDDTKVEAFVEAALRSAKPRAPEATLHAERHSIVVQGSGNRFYLGVPPPSRPAPSVWARAWAGTSLAIAVGWFWLAGAGAWESGAGIQQVAAWPFATMAGEQLLAVLAGSMLAGGAVAAVLQWLWRRG